MSKFTEGSLFFKKRVGSYADGWGEVTDENRNWEDAYRDRWAHDKTCALRMVSTVPDHVAGRST